MTQRQREQLAAQIREAAAYIAEQADDMTGSCGNFHGLQITIDLQAEAIPQIKVKRTFCPEYFRG